jgi:hypothetical protein
MFVNAFFEAPEQMVTHSDVELFFKKRKISVHDRSK